MAVSITITDGTNTVKLPMDAEFSVSYERIGSLATTANGNAVCDVIGYRKTLSADSVRLGKQDLSLLCEMIRNSPLLEVTYPYLSEDITEEFFFDIPAVKSYKYDTGGVCEWYGVDIIAVGREAV